MTHPMTDLFPDGHAYIGGRWVGADDGAQAAVTNPATGEVIGHVPRCGAAETGRAVEEASAAGQGWRARSAKERADVLRRWFDLVTARAEELALLLTLEQGKPIREARGELRQSASFLEWYAEQARRVYGEILPANTTDRRLLVTKEPVGVVAAITPWNFPSAMITRKIAPALAAGCTAVVKPPLETPLSALALAALAEEAGLPPGVLNFVTGAGGVVGTALVEHPEVRKLSFTGSTEVGKIIARDSAGSLKKLSLELGGNAPFLVFEDADLDLAVAQAVAGKFRNCGQACVAVNRIYVQEPVYEDFVARFSAAAAALRVGPGTDPMTDVGPLIDAAALGKTRKILQDALASGAELRAGGGFPGGLLVEPTVLTGVTEDMPVVREEIFGPIATVQPFGTEEEAIARANATPYGLAAYVYTTDYRRVIRVSEALQYGMVGVNESLVATEVAPFGGVKESGYGREGSHDGIEEYLVTKYVCLGGMA